MQLFKIKQTNTGNGVFAFQTIAKGVSVTEMTGKVLSTKEVEKAIRKKLIRMDDPFQIAEDTFIKLDELAYTFNHSCEPNVGFRNGIHLTALRAIKKGEEVRYDYSTVVCTHCDWHMTCLCGSKNCRKDIGPIDTLPQKTVKRYLDLKIIPEFIAQELDAPGSPDCDAVELPG